MSQRCKRLMPQQNEQKTLDIVDVPTPRHDDCDMSMIAQLADGSSGVSTFLATISVRRG
jgi:hypothetical protein